MPLADPTTNFVASMGPRFRSDILPRIGFLLLLMIGIGGAIGAVARYRLASWIYERMGPGFPTGTLFVNVSGSFLLGLLLPIPDGAASPAFRAFVTVGLLGAFTTFSTFAFEAVTLFEQRRRLRAGLYVGASVTLGLLAIAGGFLVGTALS